ncbi:hypothetical protein TRSC58_02698 [Trypanosoma rangeli SC58]|uniref:RBR-type E3 ubiquitin transferase n=1 Tax=Trypanosoma rangeli SC58 TaxID=429131 RepID=A0A061J412_TRYRA|nr:hypothetical protein TRSC58_02698 [Trypanosoma rangeli SC58]
MSWAEEDYYNAEYTVEYDNAEYTVEYDDAEGTVEYDDGDNDQWALVPSSEAERPSADIRANARLFTTLSTSEVLEGLQRDVGKANEILGLTPEAALLVLRYYGWKMDDATLEKYFAEMDDVNEKLRITEADFSGGGAGAELVRDDRPLECPICGDDVSADKTVALANCRHFMCVDCLTTNLLCAVKHGHDLLDRRCPMRGCCSIVGLKVFKELLPTKDYGQVQRRFFNDYLGGNTHMRCCPNETPCEGVIRVAVRQESGPEVRCDVCGLKFCFRCLQPPHAPATCEMMRSWAKLLQENEPSLALIQETTKGCPKCSVRVEKNMGCNHMKCTCCQYEYCWVCLGPWFNHNTSFYECNKVRKVGAKAKKTCFLSALNDGTITSAALRWRQSRYRRSLRRYENLCKTTKRPQHWTRRCRFYTTHSVYYMIVVLYS